MAIKFYNTLSRNLETFEPLVAGQVSLYCCGPTVYNYVHIGNLRALSFYDLLRRYLKYRGFKLHHVMNLTDVDDKTIRGAKAKGQKLKEYTEFFSQTLFEDMKVLRLEFPEIIPRATDEIDSMVKMIEALLKKGHAYKTPKGDIYFRIASFSEYGKLANLDNQTLRQNADNRLSNVDEYEKDQANDFALWKAWDADDGDVFWETSIGKGRPGWHIECSAMSEKYLGQPFDIHCGGVDLIFPHHTNEIAQSECACGKPFVRFWMHNEHLIVNGKKMAKSAGNYFTLRDLLNKGYDPMAMRFELIKTHYRQQLDFREDNFASNLQVLGRIKDFLSRLDGAHSGAGIPEFSTIVEKNRISFRDALDDDLNVSVALSTLFEFMGFVNKDFSQLSAADAELSKNLMREFDSVLGVMPEQSAALSPEAEALLQERELARKNKDFKKSDDLRDALLALGIVVKDTAQGMRWMRK